MHETDMTKALILTIKDWLAEQPGHAPVKTVYLTVGAFAGVEPASLQFAFQVQRQGTCVSEAELVIEDVPLVAFCHPCQQEYRPEIGLRYGCPQCRSPMEEIRSGRELKIDRLEFMDESPPESEQPIADRATAEQRTAEQQTIPA